MRTLKKLLRPRFCWHHLSRMGLLLSLVRLSFHDRRLSLDLLWSVRQSLLL